LNVVTFALFKIIETKFGKTLLWQKSRETLGIVVRLYGRVRFNAADFANRLCKFVYRRFCRKSNIDSIISLMEETVHL
jgi:hypothetical protein